MKRLAFLALPFLLAACATTPRAGTAADWLAGSWLMLGAETDYPLSCNSDEPIVYEGDGRYQTYGESGTWRLDGGRLVETATEVDAAGDPEATVIGRPALSRVDRTGPDAFRKTYADGTVATFRRCPAS